MLSNGPLLPWLLYLHWWHPSKLLVTVSALAQLLQQPLVAYRSLLQDAWQIVQRCVSDPYSHSRQNYHGGSKPTHLTGFSCVSFSFPSCFYRVPLDSASSGPRLPPALSPSFPLRCGMRQLGKSLRIGMEAHGWVEGICQPWSSIPSIG